jgi:hypothetical protein
VGGDRRGREGEGRAGRRRRRERRGAGVRHVHLGLDRPAEGCRGAAPRRGPPGQGDGLHRSRRAGRVARARGARRRRADRAAVQSGVRRGDVRDLGRAAVGRDAGGRAAGDSPRAGRAGDFPGRAAHRRPLSHHGAVQPDGAARAGGLR